MKLCIDCKHRFGWFSHCCRLAPPPEMIVDPVTGHSWLLGNNSCSLQRRWSHKPCGPEGKLWEPKEIERG